MELSLNQVFTISSQVLSQEIRGETVLLDLSSEHYFGLDAVGTRVWQLLTEAKIPDEVMSVMLNEYDVSKEQLEKDVGNLLNKLLEAGLVQLKVD